MKEPISKELFDVLACPECRGELEYTKDMKGLRCRKCKENYPIEDGIPILLPREI